MIASSVIVIRTEASNASVSNGFWPFGQLRLLCHPDDPSNARGGRASDSFAHAKPVPVSEIAQRSTILYSRSRG
jgi:hypothetical protein